MEEAGILSDRIAIIDLGKIIALDTPKNLKNSLSKSTILFLELNDWHDNLNWLFSVSNIVMLIYILISVIEFKMFYGFKFVGNPILTLIVVLVSIPSIYGIGFIFASLVM